MPICLNRAFCRRKKKFRPNVATKIWKNDKWFKFQEEDENVYEFLMKPRIFQSTRKKPESSKTKYLKCLQGKKLFSMQKVSNLNRKMKIKIVSSKMIDDGPCHSTIVAVLIGISTRVEAFPFLSIVLGSSLSSFRSSPQSQIRYIRNHRVSTWNIKFWKWINFVSN